MSLSNEKDVTAVSAIQVMSVESVGIRRYVQYKLIQRHTNYHVNDLVRIGHYLVYRQTFYTMHEYKKK